MRRFSLRWSLPGILLIGLLSLTQCSRFTFVRDPALPYVVDLKPFYTRAFLAPNGADSAFHGYSGPKTLDGLPFAVAGEIRLYGQESADRNKVNPEDISGIKIDRKFDELHLIHAVQWRTYYACPVALIRLHYGDGSTADLPVRYNFQVNDWSRLFTEDAEIIADPDTKIIWRGAGTAEGTGRLFKSVLHNPFPQKKVETMELISTRSASSYTLVAATVAQTEPGRPVTPPMPLLPNRYFDGTINVHVIDGNTGASVVGAEVHPAMTIGDISLVADAVLTNTDGIAPIKYSRVDTRDLRVEVVKQGYITCETNWQTGWDRGAIPPEVTYQLMPEATPVKGQDAH